MRQSHYFVPTLKENPADATIPSHQLMVRAGMVRQLASGVFSWLPLGNRVLNKAITILREELAKIGAQEFLLPALNPIEIWEQTNRVEAMGDVMFHLKNREGLVLAPTHEEIITYHASHHISSYKEMPQIWYQIQTKFRNEARPKSGVMRGRQFIMKDSYSLDSAWEGLDESYDKHYDAYCSIFNRCGIKFFVVGASSGAMGGKKSQEFMVESDSGEDVCAYCDDCGYAANVEVALSQVAPIGRNEGGDLVEFDTPNEKTIDELVSAYNLDVNRCAKSVVYIAKDEPILVLMRGNDELNESKLEGILGHNEYRPATEDELVKYFGANGGSLGPIGLNPKVRIMADLLLKDANGLVSGANKNAKHYKNIDFTRDCEIKEYYDFRTINAGEACPTCGKPLRVVKAIELGHIFKLGTRYSEALNAVFLDQNGKSKPIIMGSYGIGVERVIACFIEQHFDDKGITWNGPLSPFQVHILALDYKKSEEVRNVCDTLYDNLTAQGYEVLLDDRDERPGVKFADADLLGMPIQVIAGKKNVIDGKLEIKFRTEDKRDIVDISSIENIVKDYLG